MKDAVKCVYIFTLPYLSLTRGNQLTNTPGVQYVVPSGYMYIYSCIIIILSNCWFPHQDPKNVCLVEGPGE